MKQVKTPAEARQLAKGILAPDVWRFIDVKKFARSNVCELAMKAAIEHINLHRDSTVAKPWLRAFGDTEFFEAAVNYFSENASLIFTVNAGVVDFSMATVPASKYRHFLDFHAHSKCRTLKGIYGPQCRLKDSGEAYVDAMDSGKRLPGSFESNSR